jgi:SAM-dependent methyltransferase
VSAPDPVEALLAEQIAYYRASVPEYGRTAIPELPIPELERANDEMIAALEEFRPSGDVLELACGPGTWSQLILRHASALTAVDAAPEMLAAAKANVDDARVRFIHADLFTWEPPSRYDVVFFGFWLSHVPPERFEAFWSLVDRCLKPGGRFAFVDDAYRTPEELIEGEDSPTIRRQLSDGSEFRIVKVPHTLDGLRRAIEELGWEVEVAPSSGPFFFGCGTRAR